MKTLFWIIIAFILGALGGATRGLNKMKSEAVNIATQMYQSSITLMLSGDTMEQENQIEGWRDNAAEFLSGQFTNFKETAKDQASQTIKDQIDKIFQ